MYTRLRLLLVRGKNCRPYANTMKALVVEVADTPQWKVQSVCTSSVLVKVHSAGVNPLDIMMSQGYGKKLFQGLGMDLSSVVLGKEGSGTITEVGSRVWDWKKGDEVFFTPDILKSPGSFAEFCEVPQFYLAPKPKTLSFEESAGIPYPALTGWECIKHISDGQTVCIFGAGGNIGWFVMNILKNLKHCKIVAVCGPNQLARVTSCTDKVYCYTDEASMSILHQSKYDAVIDASSFKESTTDPLGIELVRRGGTYVTTNAKFIPSIDSRSSLFCGVSTGVTQLAEQKARYFREFGIDFHWVLFHPDGNALSKISGCVDNGEVLTVPIGVFGVDSYLEALEAFKTKKNSKIVIKFG